MSAAALRATGTGQTVALFSVGGDGTLTFQQSYQSQGYVSQWAQMDSSGTYLYVLDKYSPGLNARAPVCMTLRTQMATDRSRCLPPMRSTGRLTLVTNCADEGGNSVNTPFFEVGGSPFMMKTLSGCLYTANGADQTISPLAIGTGGQLLFTSTQKFITDHGSARSPQSMVPEAIYS